MKKAQVELVRKFEWFKRAREVDGIWFVTVVENVSLPTGGMAENEIEFKYWSELLEWAEWHGLEIE